MRVSSDTTLVEVSAGTSTDVVLDVINTGGVIDGITARVVGLPERQVSTKPPVLALFPATAGRLTVSLGLPSAFPAGRHPLTVEVHSRQTDTGPEYLDLDLLVPPRSSFEVVARPLVVRAHRTARFVVTVSNLGNVALDVELVAQDPEKALDATFTPRRVTIEPGRMHDVALQLRGPRLMLGSEIDRPATLTATARPAAESDIAAGVPPTAVPAAGDASAAAWASAPSSVSDASDASDAEKSIVDDVHPAPQTLVLTLRQRPWLTRGLITALILVAIIALWAAVFLFGVQKIFAPDPVTKAAPESYFIPPVALAAQNQTGVSGQPEAAPGTTLPDPVPGAPAVTAAPAAGSPDPGSSSAPVPPTPGPPPANSLARDGVVPGGMGGTIAGKVRAASTEQGVGRIRVDVFRRGADGLLQLMSSAATQEDGSYQVAGLFPTAYVVSFAADGFDPVVYPSGTDQLAATPVPAVVGQVSAGIDVTIAGHPASISGVIDPGDALTPVVTTVTVRATQGPAAGQDVATATTDGANGYTVPNLPAPAVYELSFAADGYQPSIVTTSVDGGSQRIQPTVLLSAGNGGISGVVTDGTTPIGGMTVATTVAGTTVTTGTPTTGDVGRFVLGDLPTPATYVVTVTGPGFGAATVVVDLGPGEQRADLTVAVSSGTGTVTGQLVDPSGAGIGAAIVTVGGMTNPPTTNTLTAGTVGAFTLSGLSSGGPLTLTFTHPGFVDATVPVQVGGEPLTVTMAEAFGRIGGRVTSDTGAPLSGVTVTATDGQRKWPVTSTAGAVGTTAGSYVISQLPAGSYTVTAAIDGRQSRTTLLTVVAGAQAAADFVLPGSS